MLRPGQDLLSDKSPTKYRIHKLHKTRRTPSIRRSAGFFGSHWHMQSSAQLRTTTEISAAILSLTLQRGCFSVWGLILPRRGKRPCRKGKRCHGCGNIIVAAVHCIDSRTIVHREVRIGLTLRIQRKDLRELARSLVRSWCLARVVQGSCLFLLPEESESRERVQVCAAMEITVLERSQSSTPQCCT